MGSKEYKTPKIFWEIRILYRFGFVKHVEINGDNVVIIVDITSSAPEVKAQITDDATKELQNWDLKVGGTYYSTPSSKADE